MHQIIETVDGLTLVVDDVEVAKVRTKGGKTDMLWAVYGPQDLELARKVIPGLLDLLVHFDSMEKVPVQLGERGKRKKRFELGD